MYLDAETKLRKQELAEVEEGDDMGRALQLTTDSAPRPTGAVGAPAGPFGLQRARFGTG